jgi:hypothetical protein
VNSRKSPTTPTTVIHWFCLSDSRRKRCPSTLACFGQNFRANTVFTITTADFVVPSTSVKSRPAIGARGLRKDRPLRDPQLRELRKLEARRHHSNEGVRGRIDRDRSAHESRIRRVAAAPDSVADQDKRIVRIKAVPPDRVDGRFLIRPRLAVSDSNLWVTVADAFSCPVDSVGESTGRVEL